MCGLSLSKTLAVGLQMSLLWIRAARNRSSLYRRLSILSKTNLNYGSDTDAWQQKKSDRLDAGRLAVLFSI